MNPGWFCSGAACFCRVRDGGVAGPGYLLQGSEVENALHACGPPSQIRLKRRWERERKKERTKF